MEIAEFYLKELGIVVDKAWNGKEAIDKFEESAPGTYDLILMDIMMPVMGGREAARRITDTGATGCRNGAYICHDGAGFFRKCT